MNPYFPETSSVKRGARRRRSAVNCKEAVSSAGLDFANHTSIHGVRYAFEPKQRFIERCIWIASVALCTAGAAAMVYQSIAKYYEDPTITTISSVPYRTYKVPFPAVTFCNVNFVFQSKAASLAKRLKVPYGVGLATKRMEHLLPFVALLLRPKLDIHNETMKELRILQSIFDINNISIPEVILALSQPCSEMIERCSWNGELQVCENIFIEIATLNGYCCSFNYKVSSNWTGHPDKDPDKLRTNSFGMGSGLQVLLNPMISDYIWGSFVSSGFSVVTHRPGLYPESNSLFVSPKSETLISVAPSGFDADDKLRSLDPHRRNCTFYNEKAFRSSRKYSREACIMECRAKVTEQLCGCVPFYYVEQVLQEEKRHGKLRDTSENEMSVCSLNDIACLKRHSYELESNTVMENCKCLPQCTTIDYETSTAVGDFDAVDYFYGDF